MATILVTGGAGYIGSHTCKRLAQEGFLPIVYDNLVAGHPWAVKWGPLERGDIADRSRLDEVIRRYRPQAVIHFAGCAYVGESVNAPWKYYRNNVSGSLVLQEAMHDHSVKTLIFSSSCSTYGIPNITPISESHLQNPVNPYGRTKLVVEQMLQDFAAASDLRYVSLRYFNAAGADPDGEIGESHDPETHLIPLVLEVASGHRAHIDVYGTDYRTEDGTAIRDYVHVTDLARAHVLALKYVTGGGKSLALNLGTGRGYSVRDIIKAAERATGAQIKARDCARRPGDPAKLVADATASAQILGWRPEHSDIVDILETAWRWHSKARIEPVSRDLSHRR